jgi:hypothetical protein
MNASVPHLSSSCTPVDNPVYHGGKVASSTGQIVNNLDRQWSHAASSPVNPALQHRYPESTHRVASRNTSPFMAYPQFPRPL